MKTMLFNPYIGTPRHPFDIASDPSGILMLEPDEPIRAAIAQPVQPKGDAKDANSEDVLWQLLNAVTYKTGSEFITDHRAAIEQSEQPVVCKKCGWSTS